MNKRQHIVLGQVKALYKDSENIDGLPMTEDEIRKYVSFYSQIPKLTEEEQEEVVKEVKRFVDVSIEKGKNICLEKNHAPWYKNSLAMNDKTPFWSRYRDYLCYDTDFANSAIDAIDIATDEIMDLLGNPKLPNGFGFQRKGLVVGDVQSGKTSTYIGLINKAADAGYKIIILLTGVIEKLREQTQSRLDEGFLGLESAKITKNEFDSQKPIGVGKYGEKLLVSCLTSTEKDFVSTVATSVVSSIQAFNGPILLVLKKNKSILSKVENWIRARNNLSNGEKLDVPLLLIDDEADNASVNTKTQESPTVINACIRKLLGMFTKSSYVGYTATPYANIFIKPDTDEEMEKADLFPRDFIYVLKRPDNYIGPEGIFMNDGRFSFMLKSIDEIEEEEFLPENHKNYAAVGDELPISLKEAIGSFCIANAIRDLRKHENTHRSMLINISMFNSVQNDVCKMVNSFLRAIVREVQNYSLSSEAMNHAQIAFLHNVYEKHFDLKVLGCIDEPMFSWDEILSVLYKAIAPIEIRQVNKNNPGKALNFDEYKDSGLRVIAIGGFSLSRGLTLEGLCVSYYYRNSKMYDTLMQMGRWFGYRNHYADLCQIWMGEKAKSWYREITLATKELKDELRIMTEMGRSPIDFGLWVRSDSKSLYVTALNKMKNTGVIERSITFSGKVIETPYIRDDDEKNAQIRAHVSDFVNKCLIDNKWFDSKGTGIRSKGYMIRNVSADLVVDFINDYPVELSNEYNLIGKDEICRFIKKSPLFAQWDVAISSGKGTPSMSFGGVFIPSNQRGFGITNNNTMVVLGKSSRVGDTETYAQGLTSEQFDEIKKRKHDDTGKNIGQADLFAPGVKRNPILVIYPIEFTLGKDETPEKAKASEATEIKYLKKVAQVEKSQVHPFIALGLGFPCKPGESQVKIKYRMNEVKRKQILDASDEDFANSGDDDVND